jgi:hypothetical protein
MTGVRPAGYSPPPIIATVDRLVADRVRAEWDRDAAARSLRQREKRAKKLRGRRRARATAAVDTSRAVLGLHDARVKMAGVALHASHRALDVATEDAMRTLAASLDTMRARREELAEELASARKHADGLPLHQRAEADKTVAAREAGLAASDLIIKTHEANLARVRVRLSSGEVAQAPSATDGSDGA